VILYSLGQIPNHVNAEQASELGDMHAWLLLLFLLILMTYGAAVKVAYTRTVFFYIP
jgi:hypothetical protein